MEYVSLYTPCHCLSFSQSKASHLQQRLKINRNKSQSFGIPQLFQTFLLLH